MPPIAASKKPSNVVFSVTSSEFHNKLPSEINVARTKPGPGKHIGWNRERAHYQMPNEHADCEDRQRQNNAQGAISHGAASIALPSASATWRQKAA